MSEDIKQENQTVQAPVEPSVDDKISQAVAAAERLEKANLEQKALLERAEKLRSLEILGGRGYANQTPAIDPKEKKKQDAMNFFKGSEVEDALKRFG